MTRTNHVLVTVPLPVYTSAECLVRTILDSFVICTAPCVPRTLPAQRQRAVTPESCTSGLLLQNQRSQQTQTVFVSVNPSFKPQNLPFVIDIILGDAAGWQC